MAQAVVTKSSLNVSAAIAVGSGSVPSGTLYTVPANSYAMINVYMSIGGSTSVTLSIGTKNIASTISATPSQIIGLIAGPGQAIAINNVGGTSVSSVEISGVVFTNT